MPTVRVANCSWVAWKKPWGSLALSLDTSKGLILLDGYMSNRTAQLSVVVQGAALTEVVAGCFDVRDDG